LEYSLVVVEVLDDEDMEDDFELEIITEVELMQDISEKAVNS
jgi:hypothetical protein